MKADFSENEKDGIYQASRLETGNIVTCQVDFQTMQPALDFSSPHSTWIFPKVWMLYSHSLSKNPSDSHIEHFCSSMGG